jgi:hypothetical protein
MKPSVFWQGQIRRCFATLSALDDDQLYERLREGYQEVKDNEEKSRAMGETTGQNIDVFLGGIGLLTYGCLEVIDDVLSNFPERNNARSALRALGELFPLPNSLFELEKTREWFKLHRDRLVWSEEQGKSLLTG